MHSLPKLPNIYYNDKEQADDVDQAFDLEYNVAQAFCSHIVLKAVLRFTGEAPDTSVDFGLEDGDGDDDYRIRMRRETTRGEGGRFRPFRPQQRRRVNDDNPLKRAEKCPWCPL